MSIDYVVADLIRNPRRTSATMIGVVLGVGLFCGVLFFVDGLSASMTQRAVAPLAIDMQRIVTHGAAGGLELSQVVENATTSSGDELSVSLVLEHRGETRANEVTVRSVPADGLDYVTGSAELDGRSLPDADGNPFAQGQAEAGYNLGVVEPGTSHRLTYRLRRSGGAEVSADVTLVNSTYSSNESVSPVAANQPAAVGLDELAREIAAEPGIATAASLSIADLGTDTLRAGTRVAIGPAKVFGFDSAFAERDESIVIDQGSLTVDGAVLSAEASRALAVGPGGNIDIELPDGSKLDIEVTGVADLSRSRSLFSSRRGGDLETFIYRPNVVIVSSETFADMVLPAFERAAASGSGRLKSPPILEVDIAVDRDRLDADPATAAAQTERIASQVMAIAEHQDYLLDNITNTLHVAAADATVAKRLFVFLGVPGALLAAMLAAYAGNVLAEAQRREHATLRVRGASRRDLLRMLALRTAMLTGAGAVVGLTAGYVTAAAILGRTSLERASAARLATSAVTGTLAGFVATGAALYLTGRRSIDREIAEDRARLATRAPLWRRARLDIVGLVVVVVGTVWAFATHAFDGAAGSVYFGRAVELNLRLLVLPVAVWITGSLVAARVLGSTLRRTRPASSSHLGSVGRSLLRRSLGRRPWAVSNGAIVASLIVALSTCLGVFTSSYDRAKVNDARYATGADIRITPSPTSERTYGTTDSTAFETAAIASVTPVVFGLSNVILRSDRTSDPANLAAIDPAGFARVAPVDAMTATGLDLLTGRGDTVLISTDMAAFLRTRPGDTLHVLLARATPDQVEVELTIAGLYERLPGFPDGADAVIDIGLHVAAVPDKPPDFFLAATTRSDDATLTAAVAELRDGPAAADIQIDTRIGTLDRDQSSLAALNIAGLIDLDSVFALGMATVTIAIFVFGLLLQRRREYVILRAQGVEPRTIRLLIGAEAAAVAVGGTAAGLVIGVAMGYSFVAVLRPLFVLNPVVVVPVSAIATPALLVATATLVSVVLGSRLVDSLEPTELLRDE
jgi:putative ABC transport system permease protein